MTPIAFDVLPDDVLLVIFDFYVRLPRRMLRKWEWPSWQSLVHVCRRWRCLVFGSPRRLALRLVCTSKTPARESLDIWPVLPLVIEGSIKLSFDLDNIIAALEQSDRVRRVSLSRVSGWYLEQVLARMQVPFPELTDLRLSSQSSHGGTPPVIPNSFLSGSSPRLQNFKLWGIPFPGLPNLLLTATHLVHLRLAGIPRSGFISPEAMVGLLSLLSNLDTLELEFESHQSFRDWENRSLPPPKRSILPALDKFRFKGITEYLDDLVAFIDAPQLNYFYVDFFFQTDFHTPQLTQFINRTPKLGKCDALVQFDDNFTYLKLPARSGTLELSIICREAYQRLSSIEPVCNSSLHPLFKVENLYIVNRCQPQYWIYITESTQWWQLFLPFTKVKNLYLSEAFVSTIVAALQELIGSRITEVLPSLQNIFVKGLKPSGTLQEKIGQFVAARQFSGHPIAISVWC